MKNSVKKLLDRLLTKIAVSAGFRIERNIPLALQRQAMATTAGYVLAKMPGAVASRSSHELLGWAAKKCLQDEGLVLEFGVWKGASLSLLARAFDQAVYGFDSFQGLPEDWHSGMGTGTFALDRPPQVPANAELVVGWFTETLEPFLASHPGRIKFLHVDCDLYSSTWTVLHGCAERFSTGSIIVFDEYFNYPGWQQGEFRAFQEIVTERQMRYRYLSYVGNHQQVAVELL